MTAAKPEIVEEGEGGEEDFKNLCMEKIQEGRFRDTKDGRICLPFLPHSYDSDL